MCKSVNIAILGAIALVMAGCGNDTESLSISGRVAVVDLDAVAEALGRDAWRIVGPSERGADR